MTLPRLARYACCLLPAIGTAAGADEADVEDVQIICDASRTCSFQVALRHADTGWNHYANHWRILSPDGVELGRRVLYHPHVDEQPFTRSLGGVVIPEGVSAVIVEAHDSVHEYGGKRQNARIPD